MFEKIEFNSLQNVMIDVLYILLAFFNLIRYKPFVTFYYVEPSVCGLK